MLCALHMENIAIITTLDIEFQQGLHVLTGETGAGKSIIIDAINMLLGARGSKDIIRYGKEYALCQGLFSMDSFLKSWLCEHEFPVEDELILSRTIHSDGKNVCRINGRLASASTMKTLAPYLINIHGQHDNQALLSSAEHIHFLDDFCADTIRPVLNQYKAEYAQLKQLRAQIKSLAIQEKEKDFRMDFLSKQIEEIKKAKPNTENYQKMKEQTEQMENFEELSKRLSQSYDALYAKDQSSLDTLNSAIDALTPISGALAEYSSLLSRLNNVKYELSDIADVIASLKDTLSYDPDQLNQWQSQINQLDVLQKKYNTDITGLIQLAAQDEEELTIITSAAEKIKELYGEFEAQKSIVAKTAAQLSSLRKTNAKELAARIEQELLDLNMGKAKFVIEVTRADKFMENGIDEVEFKITTNEGAPLASLNKIASGGELSRVMLAMKAVLAKSEPVGTLIFDEIDTGVSGEAGQKIAEKLAIIAQNKQVICITHLAQIAAMADTHFFIQKHSQDHTTAVKVTPIEGKDRLLELSRIMSGLSSETANAHSEILLERAHAFKENLL